MVHRTYDHQAFSPLDQIHRRNVGTLQLAWMRAMDEADYREGITHSSGAMIVDGRVLSGRTCGAARRTARCFIAAHGALAWYYQHLPCDDWDQDFVQERTLIDTVVNLDPEAVMWINPAVAGTARVRWIVVTLGEPGGLFVNDRETGEFLWAAPLPYTSTERFVIRHIDVATGQVYINMDLVVKAIGEQHVICGHNVKGWWPWSYSPPTRLLKGRQYLTVPVGGAEVFRMSNYAPELEAPIGSNMLVTFTHPD